jgi:hypothetical protein
MVGRLNHSGQARTGPACGGESRIHRDRNGEQVNGLPGGGEARTRDIQFGWQIRGLVFDPLGNVPSSALISLAPEGGRAAPSCRAVTRSAARVGVR